MDKNSVNSFDLRCEVGNAPSAFVLYGDNAFMFSNFTVGENEIVASYYRIGFSPVHTLNADQMKAVRASAFYASDHKVINAKS